MADEKNKSLCEATEEAPLLVDLSLSVACRDIIYRSRIIWLFGPVLHCIDGCRGLDVCFLQIVNFDW